MKIEIADKKNLRVDFLDLNEKVKFENHFTREKRDAKFRKYMSKVKFYKPNYNIPIQFWYEIKRLCIIEKLQYDFKEEGKLFRGVDKASLIKWCEKQIKGTEYQYYKMGDTYETVFLMVNNKYCRSDLSVAYGKTVTIYLATKYLIDHGLEKKIMVTTFKPQLCNQMIGEMIGLHVDGQFPISVWLSGKKSKNTPIVITNWQYAVNLDKKFTDMFTMLVHDECHKSAAPSYKKLYEACTNISSTIGLTGSLLEDRTAEDFSVIAMTGHTVKTVSKRDVIDQGKASDGVVCFIELDYMDIGTKIRLVEDRYNPEISKLVSLDKERDAIQIFEWRIKLLSKFSLINLKNKGNGMVLFKSVTSGYAKRFIEKLKQYDPDKKYFYVDEGTPVRLRQEFAQYMEKNNDVIMVGTYEIIGTGTSINNLHWGLMLEPVKSFFMVEQYLGRFMRKHVNKKAFVFYDIVDDGRVVYDDNGSNKTSYNYFYSWYYSRLKQYKSHGFNIQHQKFSKDEKTKSKNDNNKFKSLL